MVPRWLHWATLVPLALIALTLLAGGTAVGDGSHLDAVAVTPATDPDGDGAAAAFEVTIRADTTLEASDAFGNNPGEPYVEVEIDGEDVRETGVVERSTAYATTLRVGESALDGLEPGEHELTVELWDRDGDAKSESDLVGNDDLIDDYTTAVHYEPVTAFALEASRRRTVVGSPVTLRVPEGRDDVRRELASAPSSSAAALRGDGDGHAVTLRPDARGDYTVRADAVASGASASVTISATSDERYRLLRRYAPRLHYDAAARYEPTRYEAFLAHAKLEDDGEVVDPTPTTFDLANRPRGATLALEGSEADYPTYDEASPTTVYGSVHRNVAFRGETYTALTYWLFYVYDPKNSDGLSSLAAHESDLETVTLLLQDGEPRWVGASQHLGGELREWTKAPTAGTQLEVYPAVGAHSNYLRNSERYDDGRIPIQQQFVDPEEDGAGLYGPLSTAFADETGADRRFSVDGTVGEDYQIAVLTGEEVWANYVGAFGADADKGQAPFQRERWRSPGDWMERRLVPDEAQIDGALDAVRVGGSDGVVTAEVTVANRGVKPHPLRVLLEAKPATADWAGNRTTSLSVRTVRLGVQESRTVTLAEPRPEHPGSLDVRVRLTAYRPSVIDASDVLAVRGVRSAVDSPSTTATTRTSTPGTTTATPGTTAGAAGTGVTDSSDRTRRETAGAPSTGTGARGTTAASTTAPGVPGPGLLGALTAVAVALCVRAVVSSREHWR